MAEKLIKEIRIQCYNACGFICKPETSHINSFLNFILPHSLPTSGLIFNGRLIITNRDLSEKFLQKFCDYKNKLRGK